MEYRLGVLGLEQIYIIMLLKKLEIIKKLCAFFNNVKVTLGPQATL